jgi:hypothetical protein
VQRYGDVAGLLIIQAANGVFLIKLQRGSILQHLDDAFRHPAAGLFIQQGAHGGGGAGSQGTGERGADVGISRFTQAAAALQVDIKILPARGGADPFQVVRRMEPTSTFIFFPLSTEQEGETTVMALALR